MKLHAIMGSACVMLGACESTQLLPGEIPPRPVDAVATTSSTAETFAIDAILLGEAPRISSDPGPDAWKDYGYDIDQRTTTKLSTDVCTLRSGAPKQNQVDGNGGIDNSLGAVVLPLLITLSNTAEPSATTTADLRDGLYTLQLELAGLQAGMRSTTNISLRAFRSGRFGAGAPPFDTSAAWPVLASSVADPSDVTSALVHTDAYVAADGTVVAGPISDGVLEVPIAFGLVLPIRHAIITFVRAAGDPTHLRNGTIAGVVDGEELVAVGQRVAGFVSLSLCGSAYNGIADQLRQAEEMIRDGTNQAGTPCNAISIGIGFNAVQISNPTTVVPEPAAVDPCNAGAH